MLDGFVVPHGHFRVFHGNPTAESTNKTNHDQISYLFQARHAQKAPTDHHLREFAQLEAQIKALQLQHQQQLPVALPTSRLVYISQTAALTECFSFYSRLMTAESFTWPDFLTTVFTKLTEHFVASESDLVRKAILEVFRDSQAHVARVVDASKITTQLVGLLSGGTARKSTVWALRLIGMAPSLVKDDSAIHTSLLQSLNVHTVDETYAAIQATRAILPFSAALQRMVFDEVMAVTNQPALVTLLPFAIDAYDQKAAEQAWGFCASLFHDQVSDEDALRCLDAAAQIARNHAEAVLPQHLQLVRYVAAHDPRLLVVKTVWSTLDTVLPKIDEPAVKETFFELVLMHLNSQSSAAVKTSVLRSLVHFCAVVQGDLPVEVFEAARAFASSTPQCERLFVTMLAHCTRWELTHNKTEDCVSLNVLVQFLSPAKFIRRLKVWQATLENVAELTCEFADVIGEFVGQCFAQLICLARRQTLVEMEDALWLSLSRIGGHCASIAVRDTMEELFLPTDALASLSDDRKKTKQAIAVCLVHSACLIDAAQRDKAMQLICCQLIDTTSLNDRYEVARVAMCCGAFEIASRLLASVAQEMDHECFGSWMRGLAFISKAESMLQVSQLVTLDAYHRLVQAKAQVEAVVCTKYGFDFQVCFLTSRLEWMDAVLCAQQYSGEIIQTNRLGANRERSICQAFRSCAESFLEIRSKMLGASIVDRDVLTYHAQVCLLLASAVETFLVQELTAKQQQYPLPAVSSSSTLSPRFAMLRALHTEGKLKAERLVALDVSKQARVGATIFRQLLRAVVALPSSMPRQFFRSTSRGDRRIKSNLQFLTHAESTSATSKPRSRSQLGVAHGTNFTCTLHGSIALPRCSTIYGQVRDVEVTILLVCEKAEPPAPLRSDKPTAAVPATTTVPRKQVVQIVQVPWPTNDKKQAASKSDQYVYVPVELAVHVATDWLDAKGSYVVEAAMSLVDTHGEKWPIQSTGGRRNVIVY